MRNTITAVFTVVLLASHAAARPLYGPDNDYRETLANGAGRGLSTKAIDLQTTFAGQVPDDPGVYDARTTAPPNLSVLNLKIIWNEPTGGVTSTTGIVLRGTGTAVESDTSPTHNVLEDSWRDSKDLIIGTVSQRNLGFAPPTDHVKLQVTDVLRAFGKLQQIYPQYNRKRQYFFGGSGAGWLGLQLAFYCPDQFAEIHTHGAPSKMTTPADQQTSYTGDPPGGWNINSGFPTEQGSLPFWQWQRYQAERELRGPIFSMQNAQSVARVYSGTSLDPPLMLMAHGNADTTVSYFHFLSMFNALQSFAGQSATVTDTPEWGIGKTLGNWKFIEIYNYDHYYDRVYVSAFSRPDCFTGQKASVPPAQLDYVSPVSHGYVYHLTGTLPTATIHTESVTAAANWEMFY